jgi:hypothetical protein
MFLDILICLNIMKKKSKFLNIHVIESDSEKGRLLLDCCPRCAYNWTNLLFILKKSSGINLLDRDLQTLQLASITLLRTDIIGGIPFHVNPKSCPSFTGTGLGK